MSRGAALLALLASGVLHVVLAGVLVVVSGLAHVVDPPTAVLVEAIDASPPTSPAPATMPRPVTPPEPPQRVVERTRSVPRVPPPTLESQPIPPPPTPDRVVEETKSTQMTPPATDKPPVQPQLVSPLVEPPSAMATHEPPHEPPATSATSSLPSAGSAASPGPRPAASPSPSPAVASAPPSPSVAALPPSVSPPGDITQHARPRGGYQVRPAYPAAAQQARAEGTTMLRVHIAPDGRVDDVQVQRSAGHPALDAAAMTAVRQWQFEPARSGTTAVAMWVVVPFNFRLRGD